MADARHGLLSGLIDYAGLFPPADLDLPTALRRYDAHQHGDQAWMLGRFVLPAARLGEVVPWLAGPWTASRPLSLSLLATADDLSDVAVMMAEHAAVRVEALELKAPDADVTAWLDRLAGAVSVAGLEAAEVYIELSSENDHEVLSALAAERESFPARRLGGKLRCGGVRPDLVPPVERVADVLVIARDAGVPLKFTAGLHHPVRAMDRVGPAPMHGFLNVYAACLMAFVNGLSASDLVEILGEDDRTAFRLTPAEMAWRHCSITAEQVAALRATVAAGFGSCSFADPVTDLQTLGLLP